MLIVWLVEWTEKKKIKEQKRKACYVCVWWLVLLFRISILSVIINIRLDSVCVDIYCRRPTVWNTKISSEAHETGLPGKNKWTRNSRRTRTSHSHSIFVRISHSNRMRCVRIAMEMLHQDNNNPPTIRTHWVNTAVLHVRAQPIHQNTATEYKHMIEALRYTVSRGSIMPFRLLRIP